MVKHWLIFYSTVCLYNQMNSFFANGKPIFCLFGQQNIKFVRETGPVILRTVAEVSSLRRWELRLAKFLVPKPEDIFLGILFPVNRVMSKYLSSPVVDNVREVRSSPIFQAKPSFRYLLRHSCMLLASILRARIERTQVILFKFSTFHLFARKRIANAYPNALDIVLSFF